MFDKLEDTLLRYEEVLNELSEPDVLNDQSRYQKLMKEQSDLEPIVTKYKEYKATKAGIEDSLAMLEEESDGLYIQDIMRGGIQNDDPRIQRKVFE